MLQSLLSEMGRSTRAFCELSGRTEAVVGDVVIAMVDMGIDVDSIPVWGRDRKRSRIVIPNPGQAPAQPTPRILQAGEKKPLANYIPDHLPPFPDPHAYIRTPTHKQPVTEYEAIREKAATQKRDVERALTKFMAKTGGSSLAHSLFPDEQLCHLFPLVPPKPQSNPYLNALLPKDQIFEEDEEEEAARERAAKEPVKKVPKVPVPEELEGEPGEEGAQAAAQPGTEAPTPAPDTEVPDNPYLRPAKIKKATQPKQASFTTDQAK
jgi:transcription initiation factor TFIID subunit 8